ncbi:MAG: nicotinate-nicotinamide nucleotide adenylyltransferase [Acidobacteriota bacterium]
MVSSTIPLTHLNAYLFSLMETGRIKQSIDRVSASAEPVVEFIRRAQAGKRAGVFASSFNPVTTAHIELMRLASAQFSLDEIIALAGAANADKSKYECSLEDRLMMLTLALEADERASVGLSSHAYFVDMAEALAQVCAPETDLHFILGFDTFERVLDAEDRYRAKYHRRFASRREAIDWLLVRCRLIVAPRAGFGEREIRALAEREDLAADRVLILSAPGDLGERSATEARTRASKGGSISALVPPMVERYILEKSLYRRKGSSC